MERLQASGEQPGWISTHRAMLASSREIHISGGKVAVMIDGEEDYVDNSTAFVLDVELLQWRRAEVRPVGENRATPA